MTFPGKVLSPAKQNQGGCHEARRQDIMVLTAKTLETKLIVNTEAATAGVS